MHSSIKVGISQEKTASKKLSKLELETQEIGKGIS